MYGVCIYVGVADQLQTNYASDLRHMLKSVFDSYMSDVVARLDAAEDSSSVDAFHRGSTSPTESPFSSHLSSRPDTAPNDNNHHSTASMIGT